MNVDKSETRIRRMFGEIAGRYDLLNHVLSLNIDRYWRWRTVRTLKPSGGRILDVCTGTGDLALEFYRQTAGAADIVGSDFCHEMLVIGDKKGRRAGANGQLKWIEADSQYLPFADNYFDVVSVAFGLRNVTSTQQGLNEMARVCAPGGTVAVLEFSMPRRQPLKAAYGAYFRHVLPRIGQLLARNREGAYNYLPASVGEFPQDEALAELMREAGLVDIRWHSLTFGVATLYLGTRPTAAS